ncbi:MAG: patatin-like phospholipase family protein [Burkholderiales bacterium]|nr:patatin-like phospholipase family protein [Burkholderiales bacterium]
MTGSLHGVRIWLSGAVPPDATEAQRESILAFVAQFAALVFRSGGHILHGSHPSFTPTLLAEADRFIRAEGRKDCLTLAVSRYWSKTPDAVPIQEWREHCMVYETPESSGDNARDESLSELRRWMSERCDAFVAVGGRWWQEVAGRAGVPIEAGLAIDRGLPCFLLGGLGGAAQGFVRDHPELINFLRNGLDQDFNAAIATREDVSALVDTVCTQLTRLPLVHGRVSDGISFRILALDGGGIRGAFTASVLATLEEAIGESVGRHFDLIAGTSTGGILAVGLGMGLTPLQMLKFYRERGPVIFPVTRLLGKLRRELRHFFRPKHSQEILLEEIEAAYFPDGKQKTLGNSICRLVIPAYDAGSGACHTFRTPHNELLTADAGTCAAEVALATASAPTYFSAARVKNMIANPSYFDGGVWANCPVMAGIVEAVCYLNVPLDRIDVLSIGTTDEPFTVKMLANAGIAGWNKTLIDLLMNAQVDSAIQHARQLVGDPRFLRVNATTSQGLYKLDDSKEIESLIALGNKTASDPSILYQVKSRFLNGIATMDWKL